MSLASAEAGAGRRMLARFLAFGLALAFPLACSSKPPELGAIRARVEAHALESGGLSERLSVFASATDEDGREDLDRAHVIHDASERYWTLTRDDWILREEGADLWIGANDLALDDGSPLPRGRYRLVLVDAGGDRTERSFVVDTPETAGISLPRAVLLGDSLAISSPWPDVAVAFLDGSGALVKMAQAKPGANDLNSLFGSPEWRERAATLAVRAVDAQRNIGVWTWPIPILP